jgi:hypothetical protein
MASMALAVLILGCSLPGASPPATEPPVAEGETAEPTATEVLPTATEAIAEPTAAPSITQPMATEDAVAAEVVVAATGNLSVRRGPGLAYNVVAFLRTGQETRASGRNAVGDWLYVERPDQAGSHAWLYLGPYASVQGDPSALAVVTAEPPIPAYLRNCTFHPMRVLPGDFTLAEQFDAPNNQHQVNPGSYEAHDLNVDGDPLVFTGEVREGQAVEILTDGLHNSYSCPG